jgi:hypothetical protein
LWEETRRDARKREDDEATRFVGHRSRWRRTRFYFAVVALIADVRRAEESDVLVVQISTVSVHINGYERQRKTGFPVELF